MDTNQNTGRGDRPIYLHTSLETRTRTTVGPRSQRKRTSAKLTACMHEYTQNTLNCPASAGQAKAGNADGNHERKAQQHHTKHLRSERRRQQGSRGSVESHRHVLAPAIAPHQAHNTRPHRLKQHANTKSAKRPKRTCRWSE